MFEAELKHAGLSLSSLPEEDLLPVLKKMSVSSMEEMYAAIGYGGMTATRAVHRIRDELSPRQARP